MTSNDIPSLAPRHELQERADDTVLPGDHEDAVGVAVSISRPSAIEKPRSVSVDRQAAASRSALAPLARRERRRTRLISTA